jgi:hypothetical protein
MTNGTRKGWGVSVTPRPLFSPEKDPVPILQEAVWATGPVWTGAENLAPPGFDSRAVQPVASRYTDYATRLLDLSTTRNLSSRLHSPAALTPFTPGERSPETIKQEVG